MTNEQMILQLREEWANVQKLPDFDDNGSVSGEQVREIMCMFVPNGVSEHFARLTMEQKNMLLQEAFPEDVYQIVH